jgi:O-antigen/teichoic acid export membrane protein
LSGGKISRLVAVRIISSALQALTLLLIIRSSSIIDFGLYSALTAAGAICIGIFGFGAPTRALRIQAEKQGPELASALIAWTLVAGLLIVLALSAFTLLQSQPIRSWAFAAIVFTVSELINTFTQALLFGEERHRRAELTILLRRLIPILPIGVAVLNNTELVFAAATLGYFISIIACLYLLGKRSWSGFRFRSAVLGSSAYWAAGVWSMLQQLDVIIINFFLGAAPTGAYSAAFRLASPIHIITSSIISIMVPQLSSTPERSNRSSIGRRYLKWGSLYAGSIAVSSLAVAYAAPFVLGPDYRGYFWVIVLLLCNSALSVINQINAGRLYAEDAQTAVSAAIRLSTVVGLVAVTVAAASGSIIMATAGTLLIQIILFYRLHIHLGKLIRGPRDDE